MSSFGFGLQEAALRKGDDGSPRARRFQPPAVVEEAPWQCRPPELDGDDFPHAPTMSGRLAARLLLMVRVCVFLCRFRADGAPDAVQAKVSFGVLDRRACSRNHDH